jgi:hypothetical protein
MPERTRIKCSMRTTAASSAAMRKVCRQDARSDGVPVYVEGDSDVVAAGNIVLSSTPIQPRNTFLVNNAAKSPLVRIALALASLKLAVVLMATLAAVIAAATILETKYGRPYAQWFVYNSSWFIALLGLLGINIFFAAAVRWPWKRHQTGFVVTHAGLLVLLAGSIQTFMGGVEGQVVLLESETAAKMTLPQRSQITALWAGRPAEAPYEFTFEGGPADWRPGVTLDLGEVDGLGARVLKYYRHAEPVDQWLSDKEQAGGPLVRFRLEGAERQGAVSHFLSDQDFGDEVFVGPIRLQLQRAATDVMLKDFVDPPLGELGEKGLLLAWFEDHAERILIDDSVNQKISLGQTGAAVEIAAYLPDARPDSHGRFKSTGQAPRNPLLELMVHLPGEQAPLRQLAFAKSPLLNLDGVYGRACPVKFHYYHPAHKPTTAIELLQTSDGKLHSRVFAKGRLAAQGEVRSGSRIFLPGNFTFQIAEYLPHAVRNVVFHPVEIEQDDAKQPEPAAEVEILMAGGAQRIWLQRNHPTHGSRTISTPDGPLRVQLGHAQMPLGFAIKLVDFHRELNPGRQGNAAFSSKVRLVDVRQKVDEERNISMNEPLTHNRLTFYQSGFQEAGHGREASTFSAAYDPGRGLKYAGSLMICLGIAIMFYMRAYFFKGVPKVVSSRLAIPGSKNWWKDGDRRSAPAPHTSLEEEPEGQSVRTGTERAITSLPN